MLSPTIDGTWKLAILHAFGAFDTDGKQPFRGLTFDAAGNLYGTTVYGGYYGGGTVFQCFSFLPPKVSGNTRCCTGSPAKPEMASNLTAHQLWIHPAICRAHLFWRSVQQRRRLGAFAQE